MSSSVSPVKNPSKVTVARLAAALASLSGQRHAKANPALEGQPDSARELHEVAASQISSVAAQLVPINEKLYITSYDAVFSSPAVRAVNTVTRTSGKSPVVLEVLGVSEDPQEPLNIMFNELKYATVAAYFGHSLGDHLKTWAFQALEGIVEAIEARHGDEPLHVLFGGHAVMTPAIFWAIGVVLESEGGEREQLGRDLQALMLETNLGEAGVIYIGSNESGAQFGVINHGL